MNNALPPLREVIARHDLGAVKALGQHFLLDLNVTRKITRLAAVGAGERVLEIGPGPGGLTRALLEAGANVVAVERDRRCLTALEEIAAFYPGALHVVAGDALAVCERVIAPGPVRIVANLPYNISTELLVRWLRLNHEDSEPYWSLMALMFQREVADRILAQPGSKTYGRLSIIAQAASHPQRGFDLPARAFTPPPKVDSSVVIFRPVAKLANFRGLERLTHAAFSQRRKMLRSSLRGVWADGPDARLAVVGVPPTARAEDVPVDAYIALAADIQGN